MSLWIPCRDASGRLHWYSTSVPFFVLIPVFAICSILLVQLAIHAPLRSVGLFVFILLLGFAAFFKAKISVFQTGMWFTFGSRQMTPDMKRLYRLGYLLMVPAGAIILLLNLLLVGFHG